MSSGTATSTVSCGPEMVMPANSHEPLSNTG